MSDGGPESLAAVVTSVVRQLIADVRPRLVEAAVTGRRGQTDNVRHTDNFLSVHDLWMHRRYKELLAAAVPSFVYASEEGDPEVVGDDSDPDLCVLVDPLDTSELAVRGLNGYTHVLIYSRSMARPVLSVVGDIFHHVQLYVGEYDSGVDRAFIALDSGAEFALGPVQRRRLSESLVTNYSMRPARRFRPLSQQTDFLDALSGSGSTGAGRIGVDFGSVGLCHVAAGFTDAMVEFAKGFAAWDLYPGHYILHAAGGTVLGLDGVPIGLDYHLESLEDIAEAMSMRRKFVAAGTADLAQEILSTLRL
jgi:myo-inositol-1(or 4)-monophosphatase